MILDAVIAAGGDPEKDAELLAHAGGAPCKALIRLGERTFLEHIVSAMLGSGRIRRIAVVGLPPDHCPDLGSQVAFVPDAGGMLENGEAGLAYLQSTGEVSERVLASSGDIPLITPQVVSGLIDLVLPHHADLCYSIVSKEVMDRAFPDSGRTFVSLVDGRFAGGDMNVVKSTILNKNREKIHELIGQRKVFWKQIRAVGLDTLFLLLIHRLTIAEAERRVSKAIGFTGKVVISPYPELAMDVDKPHHLDVVCAAFARRERGTGKG
jgi:hypothetical protein